MKQVRKMREETESRSDNSKWDFFQFCFLFFSNSLHHLPLISQSFYDLSDRLFSFLTCSPNEGDWFLAFSSIFLCFQERRLNCKRKKIEMQ